MSAETPWQLKMFQKTLKKRLRLKVLKSHIGPFKESDQCLLVTCGDNNGAINYYLKEIGGSWTFADLETKSIAEMTELLNAPVLHVEENRLPFENCQFDCVVSIDVHEHLEDPGPFTLELQRIAKPNAIIIISLPNGDETKIATRIKNFIGMTKDQYGHVREGLQVTELRELMSKSGIKPMAHSTFSKVFTELLELSINFLYVKVLAKKSKTKVEKGTIAPATKNQLKSIDKSYKLYSLIYPLFSLISKLDGFFWFSEGYVVVVEGRKE
jgi:2-polyprenyl-3-methyl-5-hydroxy-6-metoxy-1,4-benzoquinol methylase